MDASALVNALVDDGPVGQRCRAELARDAHWAAPESVRVETFSALRGLYLGRKVGEQRVAEGVQALAAAIIDCVDTRLLLVRMWQLRDWVSGYDAACVAAAEANLCPLVTADRRLARTDGLRCEVRLAIPDPHPRGSA